MSACKAQTAQLLVRVVTTHTHTHTHGCRDYDDSKVLSAEQREQMYKAIGEDGNLISSTCSLSAEHISRSMLATSRTSLNELAAQATIALIQSLMDAGVNMSAVCLPSLLSPECTIDARTHPVFHLCYERSKDNVMT
jgi:ribonuclease HII